MCGAQVVLKRKGNKGSLWLIRVKGGQSFEVQRSRWIHQNDALLIPEVLLLDELDEMKRRTKGLVHPPTHSQSFALP